MKEIITKAIAEIAYKYGFTASDVNNPQPEEDIVHYQLLGFSRKDAEELAKKRPPIDVSHPLAFIYHFIRDLFNRGIKPVVDAGAEVWRGILEEIYELMTPAEVPTYADAVRSASRFLSLSYGMGLTHLGIATGLQAIGLGQFSALAQLVQMPYWTLGMGFLGWQALAPVMRATMLRPLTYHYQKRYQTRNLPPATARRLYIKGTLDRTLFIQQLAEYGLKDELLDSYVYEADAERREHLEKSPEFSPKATRLARMVDLAYDWLRLFKRYEIDEEKYKTLKDWFEEKKIELVNVVIAEFRPVFSEYEAVHREWEEEAKRVPREQIEIEPVEYLKTIPDSLVAHKRLRTFHRLLARTERIRYRPPDVEEPKPPETRKYADRETVEPKPVEEREFPPETVLRKFRYIEEPVEKPRVERLKKVKILRPPPEIPPPKYKKLERVLRGP